MAKVKIEQGELIGGRNKTDDGFEYYEFLNIPYAKPPVGNLRFKSPQSPEPWTGERDATTEDPGCICKQFHLFKFKIEGSEDCLYLNVFTPKLPTSNSELKPVMVCIHGGGFIGGSGTIKKDFCGPDYLIKHDVVLVCINYRLGPFGFLCLDIPEASGNMGLKDQVMALKWVQKNISQFGGDKNNVTIFGASAGGASVDFLLLSPLSKGLFHKAIPQSGSAINHWATNYYIKDLSLKVAKSLGCESDNVETVYEFLMGAPADQLAQTAFSTSNFFALKQTCFSFVPTVEKDFGNGDAFITDHPYNILKEKRFHDVPLMKGFCEFEGLMTMGFKSHIVNELLVTKKLTQLFNNPVDESYDDKLAKVYFDEYVKDENDGPEQPVINFCGDLDFASGIWISSKLMSKKTTPTYFYMFTYNNNFSMMDLFATMKENCDEIPTPNLTPKKKRGACHGDDIFCLMKTTNEFTFEFKERDILMVKKLSKMWSDFAKTGNPTPAITDLVPIVWPKFTSEEQSFMKIDNELEVATKYYPNKIAVFEEMYEKYRK